jgi:hypothetical protein
MQARHGPPAALALGIGAPQRIKDVRHGESSQNQGKPGEQAPNAPHPGNGAQPMANTAAKPGARAGW